MGQGLSPQYEYEALLESDTIFFLCKVTLHQFEAYGRDKSKKKAKMSAAEVGGSYPSTPVPAICTRLCWTS